MEKNKLRALPLSTKNPYTQQTVLFETNFQNSLKQFLLMCVLKFSKQQEHFKIVVGNSLSVKASFVVKKFYFQRIIMRLKKYKEEAMVARRAFFNFFFQLLGFGGWCVFFCLFFFSYFYNSPDNILFFFSNSSTVGKFARSLVWNNIYLCVFAVATGSASNCFFTFLSEMYASFTVPLSSGISEQRNFQYVNYLSATVKCFVILFRIHRRISFTYLEQIKKRKNQ